MRRLEDPRLLRGEGCYTDDWPMLDRPMMTYAAFVRSPHAHAQLLRIRPDASRPESAGAPTS